MGRRNDTDLTVTDIAGRLSTAGGRSPGRIIVVSLCVPGIAGVTPYLIAPPALGDILPATVDILTIFFAVKTSRQRHSLHVRAHSDSLTRAGNGRTDELFRIGGE